VDADHAGNTVIPIALPHPLRRPPWRTPAGNTPANKGHRGPMNDRAQSQALAFQRSAHGVTPMKLSSFAANSTIRIRVLARQAITPPPRPERKCCYHPRPSTPQRSAASNTWARSGSRARAITPAFIQGRARTRNTNSSGQRKDHHRGIAPGLNLLETQVGHSSVIPAGKYLVATFPPPPASAPMTTWRGRTGRSDSAAGVNKRNHGIRAEAFTQRDHWY